MVSFTATASTVLGSAPESYWPFFYLWVASIAALAAYAMIRYFQNSQNRGKKWYSFISENKLECLVVLALTLAAFIIRFASVATLPAPFSGDEAAFAMQAQAVNAGSLRHMFVSGLQGHPTMYFFLLSFFARFFGPELTTRLPAVLIGTLTVPFFYIFVRRLFGKLVAVGATLYLVGFHLHNHYSRFGMNNIGDPLIMVLALYFAWRVIHNQEKSDFVLLGLISGLAVYAYAGARLVFVVLFILFLCYILKNPTFLKKHILNLILAICVFCVVALPLATFWFMHPNEFMNRFNTVSVFNAGSFKDQDTGVIPIFKDILERIKDAFLLFGFRKEGGISFYDPPIPLVDGLSLALFLLGLILSIVSIKETRHCVLLLLFVSSVVLGGALNKPIESHRLLATIPVICIWIAFGLKRITEYFNFKKVHAFVFVLSFISILVAYNLWFYFHVYSNGDYYGDWNTKAAGEIGKYINTLPKNTSFFFYGLDRMYIGHPALYIQVHQYAGFDVDKEGRTTLPSPAGLSPRVFVFISNYRDAELKNLLEDCPGGAVYIFRNKFNESMFTSYELLNGSNCLPAVIS